MSEIDERERVRRLVSIDERVVFAMDALDPRVVVTCGLRAPETPPPGRLLYAVDPRPNEDPADGSHFDAFMARRIGEHVTKRRPPSLDLAVIGAGYAPALCEHIIEALRPLAHSRSVVLFLAKASARPENLSPPAWLADMLSGYDGVQLSAIEGLASAGWMVSGLDLPPSPSGTGFAPQRLPLADFLARNRLESPPMSSALIPATDAPSWPGSVVMPRYNDIILGDAAGVRWRPGEGLALGDWWGKPLELLSVGVSTAAEAGYLRADGNNRSLLVGADGLPLEASFTKVGGYGPPGSVRPAWKPPTYVLDMALRRHPVQGLRDLLEGERFEGDFFLLGRMDKRFGHFLTESLAGAWALDWALARDMRMLFIGKLLPYMQVALSLLGVDESRLLCALPGTRYERLHVPDPAHRLYGSVAPAAGQVWDRLARAATAARDAEPFRHRFLYLSRAGVPLRRLENEAALEAFLESQGGLVVRPETLDFVDQVALARRAPAIVGCVGSQLHLSMFAEPGVRKLVLGNDSFLPCEEVLIGIATGVTVDHYIEPSERSNHPRTGSWSIDLDRFEGPFKQWLAAGQA